MFCSADGCRGVRLLAILLLSFVAAACGDTGTGPTAESNAPDIPGLRQGASVEDGPFYWYRGQKIELETVAGRFVVKSAVADPAARASEVLAGLTARGGRKLTDGHQVIEVAGASDTQASAVAKRLHGHPDFTFASPVYRSGPSTGEILPLNSLMVLFKEGVSRVEIDGLNQEFGLTVEREPIEEHGWRYHILRLPESGGGDALAIANAVEEHELTEWVTLNSTSSERALDGGWDEPHFDEQWYLDDNPATGGPNNVPVDINITNAWDNTTGSDQVNVVIIDSGIDASHPDLDVLAGKDFGTDQAGCPTASTSETDPENDEPNSHGTAVAGIIAAKHDTAGIAGIAPGVNLYAIRAFCDGFEVSKQALADAINFAWSDLNADVINNSWSGGMPDDGVTSAIEWAVKDGRDFLGTVVVHSAGNSAPEDVRNFVKYPANLTQTIAVSAIDSLGNLAEYSHYGDEIDLTAPSGSVRSLCGANIVTTDITGLGACDNGPGGEVDYNGGFSGTCTECEILR